MENFYKNLDPLPLDESIVDLYKDKEHLIDLHNECELINFQYNIEESRELILTFIKDYQIPNSTNIGKKLKLVFKDVSILSLYGNSFGIDLGVFEGMKILNLDNDLINIELEIGAMVVNIESSMILLEILDPSHEELNFVKSHSVKNYKWQWWKK